MVKECLGYLWAPGHLSLGRAYGAKVGLKFWLVLFVFQDLHTNHKLSDCVIVSEVTYRLIMKKKTPAVLTNFSFSEKTKRLAHVISSYILPITVTVVYS